MKKSDVQHARKYRPSGSNVFDNIHYILVLQHFTGGGHFGWDKKSFKYARRGPGFKARGITGKVFKPKCEQTKQ